MNAPVQPCETWTEAISLLVAGCLTSVEEHELRLHLAACDACREQFEQVAVVCDGLDAARPAGFGSETDVVSRAMQAIEQPSASAGHLLSAETSRRSRWRLVAGLVVAASVLAFVTWRSFFDATSPTPNVAQDVPQERVPEPAPMTRVADTVSDEAGPPTWLALQRAFSESDEAFDTLLARHSEASQPSPLNIQSILQEL